MNDLYEQILHILKGTWRFRWWALAAAWTTCVVGWVLVGMQEDVYEAQARVYIDTSSDLRQLLGDQIVESSVSDQLRYVREALLGTAQLERVAKETGLAEGMDSEAAMRRLVDLLSQSVRIVSLTETPQWGPARTDQSYLISYHNQDRATAIAVVRKILDTFIDETLGGRRSSSEAAGAFLVDQIDEYEERLRRAEERLAAFNRKHFDRLPNMQGGYFQRLQSEIDELKGVKQALRLATSRLNQVEEQLSGSAPQVGTDGEIDPNSLEGRLAENQARLDDLRLRYTENHPDVIAAREIVGQLQLQQQERKRMIAAGSIPSNSTNPVFQALQISRNEIEAEIATLRADVVDRESQVEQLRSLIDEMPEVEAERAQLNRDYDVVRAHYQSLLNSLEMDKLSREVLESEQVDFRIIDPPAADLRPVAPNRPVLMMGVLFGSLGLGAGLAYILNLSRPVFDVQKSLQQFVADLPVIGTVSANETADARAGLRRSYVLFGVGVLGLAVSYVAMLAVELGAGGLRNLI